MNKLNFIVIFFLSCSQFQTPVEGLPLYSRHDWPHWSDTDKDCLNTRHEILVKRSLIPVTFNRRKCKVLEGKWEDYYYPQIHSYAHEVDIDHLIPLKHAHEVGAAHWTKKEKKKFANDPQNLVITDKKYNRKKGAKRIDEWLPIHKNYACKYIRDWIKIKRKYQLEITKSEARAIQSASCN